MNRVKKAILALREYLGRDVNGVRLLDEIADIANEMRRQLSTANDSKEAAILRAAKFKEESLSSSKVIAELRSQLNQSRSDASQLKRDLAAATEKIATLEQQLEPPDFDGEIPEFVERKRTFLDAPTDDDAFMLNTRKMNQLFKALRKRMNKAPVPTEKFGKFKLSDIVTEYDGDHYLTLGMFVTVCALTNTPVTIFAPRNFITDANGMNDDDFQGSKFIRWIRNWIKKDQLVGETVVPDVLTHDSRIHNLGARSKR